MSTQAKCEDRSSSDFTRNVLAGCKTRDMSAIYDSSIRLQHSRPSRGSKRDISRDDAGDHATCERASTPFSFTKVLLSTAVHTSVCCRIVNHRNCDNFVRSCFSVLARKPMAVSLVLRKVTEVDEEG
jgi:hypothetical protein